MAARLRIAALLLLTAAAACHDSVMSSPPTFDRFYYPTGMALRHDPAGCAAGTAGCRTELLVASSNFDLRYDPAMGGTVLGVDVDGALAGDPSRPAGPFADGAVLGSTQIGTFAGEMAVVDEASCPGWGRAPQVLVPSRGRDSLFRLDVGADGSLSCGPGCELPLNATFVDAYGVAVACGSFPGPNGEPAAPRHLAFVSYLRTSYLEGFISRIDLDSGAVETTYDVGPGPVQSMVFDRSRGLLFLSELFSTAGVARLRWLDLSFPQLSVNSVDYGPIVRGAELVTLALSSAPAGAPPARAYVAARLYDLDTATMSGTRPVGDLGGALLVVDLQRLLSGAAVADTLLQVVRVDRGPTALGVIPRQDAAGAPLLDPAGQPLRDLVAITSSDDGTLTLYDDDLGSAVAVFSVCGSGSTLDALAPAPCDPGWPSLGRQPFSVSYEPLIDGGAARGRLFVASFDRSWVNSIVLDPAQPAAPLSWARIGPESPFPSQLPGNQNVPVLPYPGF